mmetsp:Transcript_32717/g.33365  ORF Transcript_32717/g.33365 Transcript_32717/m.33365 type:complete len:198 (-) Transcript_32717:373-966(-)
MRNTPSMVYAYKHTNVGPGAYDVHPAKRANNTILRTSTPSLYNTERHLDEPFWPKRAGAPVGSYNIPRIMSAATGSEHGIEVTSCFKSSGRLKDLMRSGELYQTKHDAARSSHLGPGVHEIPSLIGASSSSAQRTRAAMEREKTPMRKGRHRTKGELPKFSKSKRENDILIDSEFERRTEIEIVRKLPDYNEYNTSS